MKRKLTTSPDLSTAFSSDFAGFDDPALVLLDLTLSYESLQDVPASISERAQQGDERQRRARTVRSRASIPRHAVPGHSSSGWLTGNLQGGRREKGRKITEGLRVPPALGMRLCTLS